MIRGRLAWLAAALAALSLAGAVAGLWFWRQISRPYAGWDGAEAVVLLERGLDAGSMLERLGEAGVLRSPGVLRAWLALRGGAGALQAGEYRFDSPASPFEVLDRLARGDVVLHPVTLPEGLVLEDTAAIELELEGSCGQLDVRHTSQDGVIR